LSVGIRLSILTIGWNALVGLGALVSSVVDGSLSLAGLGLNMLIDTSASAVLVWRFAKERRDPAAAHRLELWAQVWVALAMLGVALYLTAQALRALIAGSHPTTSAVGISLAGASLLALPWLAVQKLRVASRLRSDALRGDAILTAASVGLAAVTLVALLVNSWLGWRWADPAAALVIAVALLIEAGRMASKRWPAPSSAPTS
jgi:divalent metal cation (Fe/Co/Zn/Cd) transporter